MIIINAYGTLIHNTLIGCIQNLFALGNGTLLLIKIGEFRRTSKFNYSANESVDTVWGGEIICCEFGIYCFLLVMNNEPQHITVVTENFVLHGMCILLEYAKKKKKKFVLYPPIGGY